METKKYVLNTNTNTLHIFNGCYHSRTISPENKTYNTEDEAIANNQNYIKRCKICFRGR